MKILITSIAIVLTSFWASAQYTINSQFGNLTDCDTMTRGIFIIWWDNDWDYSADADELLDTMLRFREASLNDLNMQDPPNPDDGYYYNVYLHQGGDIFPDWWGNGQGTDNNGYPYLTLPIGAHNDWVNVAHETFHVFQYSANSPGFSYSGPSQWYIEAAANWFAAISYKTFPGAFLEAESLVRVPHVPLWLSYDNFPDEYPPNWQRYVHQYAMALLLFYLTEEEGIAESFISSGFYANTTELPQEYLYNELGGAVFRNYFIDWAAHMTNHFDFLTPEQIIVLENEFDTYADPQDDNEFVQTYEDSGSGGWYRPDDSLITTGWSFNTYKLLNSSTDTYRFQLKGDQIASEGDPAYFQGKVVVVNSDTGTSFYDLNVINDWEGSLDLSLTPDDAEVYFIIAAMPEIFEGMSQTFPYDMMIEKGTTAIEVLENEKPGDVKEIARYNALGQKVDKNYRGLLIIQYSDGSAEKVWKTEW